MKYNSKKKKKIEVIRVARTIEGVLFPYWLKSIKTVNLLQLFYIRILKEISWLVHLAGEDSLFKIF